MNEQPIGVFDSGLGGLTVVRALQQELPDERIVYFGDTARVPYGTKSSQTVVQFAEQDCHFLLRWQPKLVIVACNTASALALHELSHRIAVPLLGVVEPGASEAVAQAGGGPIAVLATESTVVSGAYPRAIHAHAPRLPVTQQACPSLVPLIEEGRSNDDAVLRMLLKEYLRGTCELDPAVVLLGCTHYPLIADAVAELVPGAAVVDSAAATARAARALLEDFDALAPTGSRGEASLPGDAGNGTLRCLVSDNPQRFREIGGRFLGYPIRDVTWVTPEQFFHDRIVAVDAIDT